MTLSNVWFDLTRIRRYIDPHKHANSLFCWLKKLSYLKSIQKNRNQASRSKEKGPEGKCSGFYLTNLQNTNCAFIQGRALKSLIYY